MVRSVPAHLAGRRLVLPARDGEAAERRLGYRMFTISQCEGAFLRRSNGCLMRAERV